MEQTPPVSPQTLDSQEATSDKASQAIKPQKVEFTGKGGEFFSIWIVNILLSIVTLGIYSAWAKVRTNQYFYGNTSIDGHSFRYLAKPLQILKGRVIAVALFVVYSLASSFNPALGLVLAIVMVFAFPWLLIQGLRFNLRMTSFRNVRFGFNASYGKTFVTFIVLPMLSVFTLYLALPWVMKKIDQYIHQNITYGDKVFSVHSSASTYYAAVLASIGVSLLLVFFIVMAMAVFFGSSANLINPESLSQGLGAGVVMMYALIALAYWVGLAVVSAIYRTIVRNHLVNSIVLEDITRFKSNMEILPYAWLKLTNAVMVVLTLGLAFPIAAIRVARYLAGATEVYPEPNAQHALDEIEQKSSVLGEEAADVLNVDFALG